MRPDQNGIRAKLLDCLESRVEVNKGKFKFLSSNFRLMGLMVHQCSYYTFQNNKRYIYIFHSMISMNDMSIACVAELAFLDSISRFGKDV